MSNLNPNQEMVTFKKQIWQLLNEEAKQSAIIDYLNLHGSSAVTSDERIPLVRCTKELGNYNCTLTNLTKEQIMSNPYLKNINIPKLGEGICQGDIKVEQSRRIPRRIAGPYKCPTRDPDTLKLFHHRCILAETMFFPAVTERGSFRCWMSVEPTEIDSFEKIIEDAYGNVLLFGCGLCYSAYMMALKPNVKSVKVVELNPDMIELCKREIFSQFSDDVKAKISFEQSDAIGYMQSCAELYDYVNVDIWYTTTDMIFSYLKCLGIAKTIPDTTVSYWLEDKLMIEMQSAIMKAFCDYSQRNTLDAGDILMDEIARSWVEQYASSWSTPDDFKKFINMDVKKFRDLLLEWYNNNMELVAKAEGISRKMESVLSGGHAK